MPKKRKIFSGVADGLCHFERQNGEKRRGIPISPEPPKTASQGRVPLGREFL